MAQRERDWLILRNEEPVGRRIETFYRKYFFFIYSVIKSSNATSLTLNPAWSVPGTGTRA